MAAAVAEEQRSRAAASEAIAANAAKSAFLATMSHELRTPLNIILGYSELVLENLQHRGDGENADDVRRIVGAGEHLLGLISDILDLSRIEAERLTVARERFDLGELVRAVAPGDSVLPMIFVTHRHPEFWSEPERFDPERFIPGLVAERHPCAYLPFGAGPRICLGMNFALQEMILLVASVAQRMRMNLSPGQQLIIDISAATLRLRDHLRVRVERRA